MDEDDQPFFGDGLAEEILNLLSPINGLKVSSRTSAFTFRDGTTKMSDISKALGVDHILEGSIRRSGKTLRVTAQLIDAKQDQHIWSETYDRLYTADNLLQIQDDIAREISNKLAIALGLPAPARLPQIGSTEAYQHYLSGRD